MYSSLVYLYQQKKTVVLLDTSGAYFDLRWRPVYAKNLRISKGVDNTLLFQFKNQEQRNVDLTDYSFIFRIIASDGTELILAKPLIEVAPLTGKMKVVITESDLDSVIAQIASYSIELIGSELEEPVFVDDDASSRGVIEIVDGVLPKFVASTEITVPSLDDSSIVSSSVWQPHRYEQTIQYTVTGFTGTITVKANNIDSDNDWEWYDVSDPIVLSNETATKYINIVGWFPFVKLEIEATDGTISNVYVR